MLSQNNPDRVRIVFDDHRLVANAGLLLPVTLAPTPGPGGTRRPSPRSRQRPGAGQHGRQDDDAGGLRAGWWRLHRRRRCVAPGGTACTLGGTVKAPSTLGTFLRSFRWGHVRQLDRVSRELLAWAWQAVAGPGDGAVHHRPGLHHLRDLRAGQGRGATP